jgi:GntR family transcriptional repressor for pyruvate dehydrogenase complex
MLEPSSSPLFERLDRKPRLTDEIAQNLTGAILEGRLKPGDQLPTEQSLAGSFGVARTVVREAISRLKHDGLISARQGIGAFVAEPSARTAFRISPACFEKRRELLKILQLRTGVSAEAASLAARLRTDRHLADLRAAFGEMTDSISEGAAAAERRVAAELAFYNTIAAASDNQYIQEFLSMLDTRLTEELRSVVVKNARAAEWGTEILGEHRAVLEAVEARRPEEAARSVRLHYENAARRLADRADVADV